MNLRYLRVMGMAVAMNASCFLLVGASYEGVCETADQSSWWGASDTVCGPRCLQFVLGQYGIKEDLVELVREIQLSDSQAGSNLSDLKKSLECRGVFTRALKLSCEWRLQWQYPVIVHLSPKSGNLGHYVVLLPGDRGRLRIWDGLNGERSVSYDGLRSEASGIVLLTSPRWIDNVDKSVSVDAAISPLVLVMYGVCGCVGMLLVVEVLRTVVER